MRRRLIAAAAALALLLSGTNAEAADPPTRPEYVVQLEAICKPDSEATQRAVRGTRADVRSERLRRAARKVEAARRIFAGTVRSIAAVPRPPGYEATLDRWFAALDRETAALKRTAAVLRAENVPGFQRVWAEFIHEGNKANNVVVSFGFDYCDFKPSRFA